MDSYLPAVSQMSEITHNLQLLAIAVLVGAGTIVGVFVATMRWWIPARFKQQTAERQAQLEALKSDLETKRAAETVDIERDRMLPKLIESTITMSQSFNATMMQSIQQTAAYSAQLSAHDRMLSANTDRLEELAQTVDTAITNIQVLKSAVEANTDHTKTAALYGEVAAKTAQETLELVKRKIIQVVADSKSDTGELKPVTPDPATADGAPDTSTGSAAA